MTKPLKNGATVTRKRTGDDTRSTQDAVTSRSDLVPGWLALLVLVLLLAVAAIGGFIIRGLLVGGDQPTRAEYDVADLERRVDRDPTDVDSLLSLGYAYESVGRYEDALAAFDQVLELDPSNSGVRYYRGMTLMQLKRFKEAEVALWDALETTPDHALAAKALGEYYIAKKQYKSALAALEPVIELRPHFADLQYLAGYACEQLGRDDEAIEYYRQALTYAPEMVEAKDGLTRLGGGE